MDIGNFLYLLFFKEIKITEPLTCLNFQIMFFKILGAWELDTNNKIILKLYSIYAFVTRILFIYTIVGTEILFFHEAKDVQTIAVGTFISITILAMGYKVNTFNSKFKRMQALLKQIELNKLLCVKDSIEANFLEISMKRSFLFLVGFGVPIVMAGSGFCTAPFFDKDEDEMHLPFPARFPFDIHSSSIIFCITYVFQIVGALYCVFFDIAWDTFIMGIISIMDAQIKILGHRFAQIGFIEKQYENQTGKDKKLMVEYNRLNANENTDLYSKIINCIIEHDQILRNIREFESIFHDAIFVQLIAAVLIVCMTALLLLNTISASVSFATLILYLICMIFQIFIYCWIANELTYTSAQLTYSAYFCNFHIFDNRTKKALLIFMQRSTQEIKIKVGGLFQILLSLENFMKIIKTSYTYLAVLRNVQTGTKLG